MATEHTDILNLQVAPATDIWVNRLSSELHTYSPWTHEHSIRTAILSRELAKYIGLSSEEVKEMEISGLMYDIGKLQTPKELLDRNGSLSIDEQLVVMKHAGNGFLLLKKIADQEADEEKKCLSKQ